MTMLKTRWNCHVNKKFFSLFFFTQESITSQSQHPHNSPKNVCGQLRIHCKQGRLSKALEILHNVIDKREIHPDLYTYVSLLQASLNIKSITQTKVIHAHLIVTGIQIDFWLGNQLLTTYSECGRVANAHQLLQELPSRNHVSFTAIISAYSKEGNGVESLKVFCQMQREGIRPDSFTFSAVVSACAKMGTLKQGEEVHGNIIRSGFQFNVVVGSGIVDMYVKCGKMKVTRQAFDKMPERNVVSWTSMIAGYAQEGPVDEAMMLFERMPERNVVSWTAMIVACVRNGWLDQALKLFDEMPERNVVSWNAMIAGYGQNGRVDMAMDLFSKMPERSVVSWNAMIAGYEQNGRIDEAVALFKQMVSSGVRPDPDTFSNVIPACAQLAVLQQGKETHEEVIRRGFEFDAFIRSALVDMYAKCGSIEDARKMFDRMPRQNVVSWTSMIMGYSMHGMSWEALHLFEQMQQSDIKPDSITFVGVLSACCHAGLVDDGLHHFYSISKEYHMEPILEHFCCMVDLLGRAGHLDEAIDFVHKMPIKPNVNIWISLLAACRVHNNIKLAEHVAENLIELDPVNSTHYVLLSNIYAAAGRWDDMEKVRTMMKGKGVKKVPGYSWIEVNDKVYPFFIGGTSYPQPEKIYSNPWSLSGQI